MNNLHSSDRQISCDLRSNLPIHNKELDVGQGSHKLNSSEVCGKIREGVGKKKPKNKIFTLGGAGGSRLPLSFFQLLFFF